MAKRSARKTSPKRINKTAAIRSILAKHPEAKPLEVVGRLKRRGITVSRAYVSVAKSKMKARSGRSRPRRRRSPAVSGMNGHLEQLQRAYLDGLSARRRELLAELRRIERQRAAIG